MRSLILKIIYTTLYLSLFGFASMTTLCGQVDTTPTMRNIAYGKDPRNVFDFYQSRRSGISPLVIYLHGGGFRSGDKDLGGRQVEVMNTFRNRGISFVSATYRLTHTTRIDSILMDGELLVRYIKANADVLKIDTSQIGMYGTSAGGCIVLWIAFNAKEGNNQAIDPVERRDTKIKAAAHVTSPSTLDVAQWGRILNIDSNWMDIFNFQEDFSLYKISNRSQYNDSAIIQLRSLIDLPKYIDHNDPVVMYSNANEIKAPAASGDITHHALHAYYLDSVSTVRGHRHRLNHELNGVLNYKNIIDFFCEELGCQPDSNIDDENKSTCDFLMQSMPNNIYQIADNQLVCRIYDLQGKLLMQSNINEASKLSLSDEIKRHVSSGPYVLQLQGTNFTCVDIQLFFSH